MDIIDQTNEDIPTNRIDLLQQMKSMKIINLMRYSWDPIEYVIEELQVPEADIFRFTLGPLVITLENQVQIGFSSIPEQASVVVWLEESPGLSPQREGRLAGDPDFYPIEVTDSRHGDEKIFKTIGSSIESIHILKRAPQNAILAGLPREAGIMITCSNGLQLIASHGLHNNSDDFSVILKEDIKEDILSELAYIEV